MLKLRAIVLLLLLQHAQSAPTSNSRKNVLFIVGDDVGYNDLGAFNGKKTQTPVLDNLVDTGVTLTDYYTFKVVQHIWSWGVY